MIVLSAIVPPVAYSLSSKSLNNPLTSFEGLLVKNNVQWPYNSSDILYEFGINDDSSSFPKAIEMTLFFPIKNLESVRLSLKGLKLLVVIFS